MEPLEIVYRDDFIVAINKPSGLLVHRSPVDKREKRFAVQMLRDQIGQYVYPVHRLDRPTSGVLLFALTPETAGRFGELWKTGNVTKKYIAVVRGYIEEKGTIHHPLGQVKDKRLSKWKAEEHRIDQAITSYKRLGRLELPFRVDKYATTRYSLVELYPNTGRRHQLRRHMKHISHPIIGDTKYGKKKHNDFFKNHFNCNRLLLSATSLSFIHPEIGTHITITAKVDSGFETVLEFFH